MLEPFCRKDPLFFFVSLAFPWFGLLCHISPLRVFSGHSTLVFTLRTDDEAYTSTPNPHLLWADKSMWTASQLVILWWFSFFWGGGVVALWDYKVPHWPHLWQCFLLCGNFFFMTPSPGWVSVPKSFVSLFVFIFFPTSFCSYWFALGIWGPLPVFRICFLEAAPHADNLLMYLLGRKWSPHPISLPSWYCLFLAFSV